MIASRAATLESIVQADPEEALAAGFSSDLLDQLSDAFPGSANALEKRRLWSGICEVELGDDLNLQGTETRGLRIGNRWVELFFASDDDPEPGSTIDAAGMMVGGSMATSSAQEAAPAAATCSDIGNQRVVVIKVLFSNTSATLANSSISDWFFGTGNTVSKYWLENSFNQTWAAMEVWPWDSLGLIPTRI